MKFDVGNKKAILSDGSTFPTRVIGLWLDVDLSEQADLTEAIATSDARGFGSNVVYLNRELVEMSREQAIEIAGFMADKWREYQKALLGMTDNVGVAPAEDATRFRPAGASLVSAMRRRSALRQGGYR